MKKLWTLRQSFGTDDHKLRTCGKKLLAFDQKLTILEPKLRSFGKSF